MNKFILLLALVLLIATQSDSFSAGRNRPTHRPSGRCTQLDPGFAYFQNRSLDSIAEEVAAHGYRTVSITSTGGGSFPLADVLAGYGIRVRLLIVPMNGTYLPATLPQGWESWKMVHKDPNYDLGSFAYFCLNNPEFRKFKQKQIVDTLRANPSFEAVDLAEPQVPAWGGPDNPGYACLCQTCRNLFLAQHPEETDIPDFYDSSSPKFWKTNNTLYMKWVEFRVNSVVSFLNYLVNGPGGIRQSCRGVQVITWTLGCKDAGGDVVAIEREWQAMDAREVVKRIRPDAHCIQTDWPDWCNTQLRADYPTAYAPYLASIRSVNSHIPVTLQTDSGSLPAMRRSFQWLGEFDQAARQVGFIQTLDYQYHLGSDFYAKSPSLVEARLSTSGDQLTLVYDMYVDPAIADDISNYTLSQGSITSVQSDGNLVILGVSGTASGQTITIIRMGNYPAVLCHPGSPQNISGVSTTAITAE